MEITVNCRLAGALAAAMRDSRAELTRRWLDRIVARVSIDPNRVFPTNELLNHVPLLVEGIADYMEDPAEEISADGPVIAKAMELGEMRFEQGFDAYQILWEYEVLGGVLFAFLVRTVDDIDEPCTRGELLACAHRLFRAVSVIEQVTATHYLAMVNVRVGDREQRLRGFNRMVSHELKNRIGALLGAGQLLQEDWIHDDPARRAKLTAIVVDNAQEMQGVLQNLIDLSRVEGDSRRQRNVLLPEVAAEVVRQLRELARVHGVQIRIAPDLPPVEVNAAAVELCLSNYVSNAVKYSDPAKPERWVEIGGQMDDAWQRGGWGLTVEVRDNGLGVPEEARAQLFRRFFRAHETVTGVEGTGLGLSIVRDTMEGLGGRAWARFDEPGVSVFAITLPCRRREDPDPS
jgi:signal transduction histidine kinase